MEKPTFDITTQASDQVASQGKVAGYIFIPIRTLMDIFGCTRIPRKLKKKYRKGIRLNISHFNHSVELRPKNI